MSSIVAAARKYLDIKYLDIKRDSNIVSLPAPALLPGTVIVGLRTNLQ